ncbi:hypothetical protein MRB53_011403 [Persea americana]|uniref:Uncharacterized protein n=1 Tax=Persea americana TaxID=3435 RepID=A0ACC2LUI1_PERAE|nr:hypothetical protein MRB53_011403 [Persea americana]
MTKVPMGPPPPKNPNPPKPDPNPPPPDPNQQHHHHQHQQEDVEESKVSIADEIPNPNPSPSSTTSSDEDGASIRDQDPNSNSTIIPIETSAAEVEAATAASVPYTIPPWSERPGHPFSLEVLKDGAIIEQLDVSGKGAYMFGRVDLCDFVLEHPTISRFHAVIQFKGSGDAFLYDLGSTHGTSINKTQVKIKVYNELHVGDVIRFGHSSRLYIFQGPSELMPPEKDLKHLRNAKIREEMQDCEASLLRARVEASLADGISWGMTEDAIEENPEDDADEVTWQTYKGQLTEKQEKTREKVIKRLEKVANMKKEIDAIRAKDIAQGGLTQGQQTQIARNEQRMSQIMEELESLEETLNESIQESLGARAGRSVYGKKKGTTEDEDEVLSDDDDEFYDRTKKKPTIQKAGDQQTVETADTLLSKQDSIIKEMEEKTNLLMKKKTKVEPKIEGNSESGDALDAYMNGLSSQLVLDATARLQQDLNSLQSELDRIQYLLKIADPMGEAAQRRDSKALKDKEALATGENKQASKSKQPDIPMSNSTERLPKEKKSTVNGSSLKDKEPLATGENKHLEDNKVAKRIENKAPKYTVAKPIWLGATEDMKIEEKHEAPLNVNESDGFVSYKDRKKALAQADETRATESMIEDAAPGLIIRKRKLPEKAVGSDELTPELSASSSATENTAIDAVALLLKHKRGYFASEGDERDENQESQGGNQTRKQNTVMKRVLGPERPDFLNRSPESESWVPPQGQSGDGRTSLNDRYGY